MRDLDPIFLDERIKKLEEGGSGSSDYATLSNKPKIEGTELVGNKTFEDLGIASAEDLAQTNDDLLDVTTEVNSLKIYSNEEQVVGTWVNGKPIYRKVFSGTVADFVASTSRYASSNLLTNNVDEIINCGGQVVMGSSASAKATYSINSTEMSSSNVIQKTNFISLSDTNDLMLILHAVSNHTYKGTYKLFVEYTKTTD